ncbi:MAG: DUF3488 and transglutaminase-like domain-containing protein [Xanthomonadales bacterium]|nr:DUF3488 and transglutaminase-like domain-containing protein [Xanthomonadales bacterium]
MSKAPLSSRAFSLLCLSIGWTLAMHVGHIPVWLSLPLALVLLGRWLQRRHHPTWRVPMWLKLPLVLLLVVVIISTYGTLFGRSPGSVLAVGLLVLKTLESETARDARAAMAFACFTLMSALLFDQTLVTSLLVGLGLLPALATLHALQPQRLLTDAPRHELTLPGLILLASLPLALMAFVFVPRLSTPLWGGAQPDQARTGLAAQMTPGNFTQLLIDDSPAMRVGFDGPPPKPAQRYFRGYVMSMFDGRTWQIAIHHGPPAPVQAITRIGYTITLEPNAAHVLPALDVPITDAPHARMLHDHQIIAYKRIDQRRDYHLESALTYRFQSALSPQQRRRELELPHAYNPRTHALAAQWRKHYGNHEHDAAIVQAALKLFHDGGFIYTLTPPELGRNSVDEFLFDTHAGFCEHYASSFTVLMRAAGIPARVVTGYQGGYWNSLANYLLVRNSDAHAWSEVWLAGRGWVRVDPTAAVRPQRVSLGAAAAAAPGELRWYQAQWLQNLSNQWDVVNRLWGRAVVGFDALRQQSVLTPFGIDHADWSTLALALGIGCGALLALSALLILWRRPQRQPIALAWRALQRKLARAGVPRRPNEGPRDYMRRAALQLPAQASQLNALSARYLSLRYAYLVPDRERIHVYARMVREFHPSSVVKLK